MAAPLEVRVADQHGVDVRQLVDILKAYYRSVHGNPVNVSVGQGQYVDGVPAGMLVLVDRTT